MIDTLIVAHGSGWDEMLVLLAPLALIVVLRLVARRRQHRVHPPSGGEQGGEPDPG